MRHDYALLSVDKIAIEQEVEIECTRAARFRPDPTQLFFHGEKDTEEVRWLQFGLHLSRGIEISSLPQGATNWGSLIIR
jgi:hypothetical protein